MPFDGIPIWAILLGTIALGLAGLEMGVLLGRSRQRRRYEKLESAGGMVAVMMGLLAFMLAFTFTAAANRHDARRALVVDEANAIETTWLRAGFLAEPYRADIRRLLQDYVDVRVKAANGEIELGEALRQSEGLHERMWAVAVDAGRKDAGSITIGLVVQSLNEVIDLHLKRVTAALRDRIPVAIWLTLYLLIVIGAVMMGLEIGQGRTRHFPLELAVAVSFSIVLVMIVDLDRPFEGLVDVSQQATVDLQTKLKNR